MATNDRDTTTDDRTGDPGPDRDSDPGSDQEIDLAPVGRLDDQLTEAASSGFGELHATYEALADGGVPETRALTAAAAGIAEAVERVHRADADREGQSQSHSQPRSDSGSGVGGTSASTDDGTGTPGQGRNRSTS